MRALPKALAAAAIAACALSIPAVQAAGDDPNPNYFVKMCDENKDGMVSKEEVMKMVEKMFDKHDKKKMGKLDKKQAEEFLKEFMGHSGGG
jgi:hypothetical protein